MNKERIGCARILFGVLCTSLLRDPLIDYQLNGAYSIIIYLLKMMRILRKIVINMIILEITGCSNFC